MAADAVDSEPIDGYERVTVLVVIFIGGAVAGFYGLVLAIPVAACLKILAEELVLPRWKQWASEH